jgi:Tol biopolymer transport system component
VRALALLLALVAAAAAGAAPAPRELDRDPRLSPRADRVAYWRHSSGDRGWWLTTIRAAGGGRRTLVRSASPGRFAWAPDGRRIAYTNGEIYVVASTGGRARRLTHDVPQRADQVYVDRWLDTRTIGYTQSLCCTNGIPEEYDVAVDVDGRPVSRRGGKPACPDPDIECYVQPRGTRVAWSDWNDATHTGSVYVADAGGANRISLGGGCCASWSFDGRYLAFNSTAAQRIVVVLPDGTRVAPHGPATAPGSLASVFSWSPVQDVLAFVAPAADGATQLWVGPAAGADRAVTAEPRGLVRLGDFAWSPHGRWLTYQTRAAARMLVTHVVDRTGGPSRVLVRWRVRTEKDGYPLADEFSSLDWGPGDRWAVYFDACRAGEAIFRVAPATGRTRRLTNRC